VADPLLGSLPINASPTAGKTKKPAEQTPVKKPLVDVAALLSAPFFGKASHLDLKKAESHEFYSRYPYSIQLDSFRTLVEAKNAVTLYREKGLFTYWCEVSPEENERWFRVYAGFFESRKQAKKYREEENLHKSLVKRTPKNALLKSLIDKPILDYQAFVKKSRPSSREENKNNKKPSILKSTEPDPVPLNKDAPPEKVGVSEQSRPKVGASSNEKAIYFWGLTPPNPRMGHSSPYTARGNLAFSHKPSSILKIPERRSEASNSNLSGISAPALAGSMPKSTLPRGVEKKGQATTDQAPPKKPSIEMSTLFSEPFFAMAIDSDLNRAGGQDAYPRYPYSIQLGSFRTLDQTRKAVESYRKKGLMAYWSEVEGEGNKRWFRVYAGFFESRAEARRYREEKSLTKSLVKKTPYSTFVGTYRDKQVLEDQTLLLKSLDYLPYAIEEQDGRYRLFVGAFLSKKVAEEKRLDLESKGIQSQVIKR